MTTKLQTIMGLAGIDEYQNDSALGAIGEFQDLDYDQDSVATQAMLSGQTVYAMYSKNTSGGLLLPGVGLQIDSGTIADMGGESIATTQADGFVSPFVISTGVPDGSYFWAIIGGPTKILSSAAFSAGAFLKTAAAGKVQTGAIGDAHLAVGRAYAAASGADELVRAFIKLQRSRG